MNKMFLLSAGTACLLAVTQNACFNCSDLPGKTAEMKGVFTAENPEKSVSLSDPVWKNAPSYKLALAKHAFDRQPFSVQQAFQNGPIDAGEVKLLWDEKNLYVGFFFNDKDLVSETSVDQDRSEGKGDTAVVYLKNEASPCYWQFIVTPLNKKSVFFCPGRGRQGLPSTIQEKAPVKGFRSAVTFKGTIGKPADEDVCWGGVMVIPLKSLQLPKNVKSENWRILVGRGNYSRYLPLKEQTSFPGLQYVNFTSYEEYAALKLEK